MGGNYLKNPDFIRKKSQDYTTHSNVFSPLIRIFSTDAQDDGSRIGKLIFWWGGLGAGGAVETEEQGAKMDQVGVLK